MATISFADRENAGLVVPALKARQRLQSAPELTLKTPLNAKRFHTPLQSHRKALGARINATPVINRQEKSQKTQETEVKCVPLAKVEEYPDIEKCFPYDPLEFEKDYIPEDVVPIGCLALAGLACYPNIPGLPEDDFELSFEGPIKMPENPDLDAELDAFLQTINELTIDFPPEPESD